MGIERQTPKLPNPIRGKSLHLAEGSGADKRFSAGLFAFHQHSCNPG